MADEWTPSEHVRALRGYLERVRDGEDPVPRSGAWVALDHLEALAASSPLSASGLSEEEKERWYGLAGKTAGEAVLEHGRDGAKLRPADDAFLLSRIARAIVDVLAARLASPEKGERA